ncbi:MAG: flagellar protein FlgN [Planctomycetaceae bacterium]|nr:MAG: flagellar protein FlgN [Planctomycetaceae bacterium]
MPEKVENNVQHGEIENKILSTYSSLILTLREEINLFNELRNLLLSEREKLVRCSVEELNKNNETKERLIRKAGKFNKTRMNLVSKIVKLSGMNDDVKSLSSLILYADEDHKMELIECQSLLHPLMNTLVELNEGNKELLDSSIYYTQKSLDFLRELTSPSSTYMETGGLRADNDTNGQLISQVG